MLPLHLETIIAAHRPGTLSLLAALLVGCGATPVEQMQTARPLVVDEVVVQGVTRFERDELLSYLTLEAPSFWPWVASPRYGEAFVRDDRARVEALYAAFGHPKAQVKAFGIERLVEGEPEVRVHIEVDEGPAIQVTAVDYQGGAPPVGVGPRVGHPFAVPDLDAGRKAIVDALQADGHGYADAQAFAEVDRDALTARLRYAITPGPKLVARDVRFQGLEAVPLDLVRQEVRFVRDTPYSETLRQRVEQAVYGVDMFSAVAVKLPLPPPQDGRVVLQVEVQERPPDDLKLGVGFGFSPIRWDEWLTARYTHRNLFQRLTRLDLKVKAGWTQIPDPFEPTSDGPLVQVEPKLTRKGWLDPALQWTLTPSYELGVEQGYKYQAGRVRPGVSRFFFGKLRLAVNHTLEIYDFFEIDPELNGAVTRLGLDFADPYLLSYTTLDGRLYLTDDLFEPTNGLVLGATWDIAGGALGGDFEFHRWVPELSAYWRPAARLQLAARAQVGLIKAPADSGAPFAMKLYLGGHRTVRGWGANRLSPQVAEGCARDAPCKGIPIGGATSVLGNLEARVQVVGPVELATFLDVGDVQTQEFHVAWDELNYASGLGLRVATPIGRFRLDVGFRLNDPARFAGEDRWALHLALGEAF
ncbi:MAG: BamA/TamA family outer membrane protein [Myxococcales bacterium]|nr:BamA/TamA family outer membrane protein [Myxococcales bacterium]